MPPVVAIRHVPFEDLDGFTSVLVGRGHDISYREAAIDDLTASDLVSAALVVVLGGPIGVYDDRRYRFLRDEVALIEKRLERGRPVLGVCLGAQLMARALGARVYPAGFKEIGWAPLRLTGDGQNACLRHLEPATRVLHWHGDTFDLPPDARRLASTPRTPNQAFAVEHYGLGLQFHLETTARGLERWLVGHAVEIGHTPRLSIQKLRADTARYAGTLELKARACLETWLDDLEA